jgi:hypothetical protein
MPDVRLVAALLEPAGMTDDGDNIIHFNPWRDFNDAPTVVDALVAIGRQWLAAAGSTFFWSGRMGRSFS